jgi:prepilin-type N-terminal cleavage/methylation domain-containing protein
VTVSCETVSKVARRRDRQAGFTLLELLVVCAVIGIIANIAIPEMYQSIYRAKAGRIIEDYNMLRTTVHQYYADHSSYPAEEGPGIEPPELTSYMQHRLTWSHDDYDYDWELWVDGSGDPTNPGTGVLVGFSIVTGDARLTQALHAMYKGIVLDTVPNHTTFVIEPYNG